MKHLKDSQLAALARDGDAKAFEEIVERYRDVIYGFCYWRVKNFEDARDLCQETFIQAYSKLHQLRDADKLGAWLRVIAANSCAAWARRRREVPVEDLDPPNPPTRSQETENVSEALSCLPEKERLAVVLHYVDGLSYDDVADFLEISKASVRNRLHRGRQMLRTEVLKMTKDAFDDNRLDERFTFQTIMLAQSFTRLGLGWSPDGKHILCQRYIDDRAQLWITDTHGSDARPITEAGWQSGCGWSPDSNKIAFAQIRKDGDVHFWNYCIHNVAPGTTHVNPTDITMEQYSAQTGWHTPVWSPDSRRFVYLNGRLGGDRFSVDAYLYDAQTGDCEPIAPNLYQVGTVYPGQWSHDSKVFYFSARAGQDDGWRMYTYDGPGQEPRLLSSPELRVLSDPRLSPDGRWIAFTCINSHDLQDVWLMRPDGSEAHPVAVGYSPVQTESASYRELEWTNDGKYITVWSNRYDAHGIEYSGLRLIDPFSGEVITVIESEPESEEYIIGFRDKISRSPDGKKLAMVLAHFTMKGKDTPSPQYSDRHDRVYWYDIPQRKLHMIREEKPDEGDTALYRGGYDWSPVWSPDSSRILFTEGKIVERIADSSESAQGARLTSPPLTFTVYDHQQGKTETKLCIAEIV